MGNHAVGDSADHLRHRRADRPAQDGDVRVCNRAGVEERLQLGECVMLADKLKPLARLEAVEDRLHSLHVFAQLRHRRIPARAVALLDIGLDLRAETHFKAPAGHGLQIPGRDRRDHRAARECHQHRRSNDQRTGCVQRQRREQQAVVDRIRHLQAVEAHRLRARRVGPDLSRPHILRCRCEYLKHDLTPCYLES